MASFGCGGGSQRQELVRHLVGVNDSAPPVGERGHPIAPIIEMSVSTRAKIKDRKMNIREISDDDLVMRAVSHVERKDPCARPWEITSFVIHERSKTLVIVCDIERRILKILKVEPRIYEIKGIQKSLTALTGR